MLCWLNGRLLPVDQARVPVLDRGLLYGDSLFETLRVQAGHLRHLDWHLERFLCAANRLAWDCSGGGDRPGCSGRHPRGRAEGRAR
jgi:branched-subunit amino acid aminotransferase/4-amino-4-deoxychorismate lyase